MALENFLKRPLASDDKYSRGVVGFVTGSQNFAGAALLGITAAMRTGIGMVRYLGPESVSNLILQTRPEIVLQDGKVQAWVVGSGVSPEDAEQAERILAIAKTDALIVVDAGALQIIDFEKTAATCVLTPHAGEAAKFLNSLGHAISREQIESEPVEHALLIASLTKQTVLLKGNQTVVARNGKSFQFAPAPAVLATAGSGDVLAGIVGALLASNAQEITAGTADLFEVVLAGVELQALAASKAAQSSTVVALDIAEAVGQVVAGIQRKVPTS